MAFLFRIGLIRVVNIPEITRNALFCVAYIRRVLKLGQALEQAAQGSDGVTIPGGVQKMCRCATLGHGDGWT